MTEAVQPYVDPQESSLGVLPVVTLPATDSGVAALPGGGAAMMRWRAAGRGLWQTVGPLAVVVGLTALSNLILYLFPALTAHHLQPNAYASFAAVFGLVVLSGVGLTALQTQVAATAATSGWSRSSQGRRTLLIRSGGGAVAVLAASWALSPVLADFLRVGDRWEPLAAGAVIAVLVPSVVILGMLQGSARFISYSVFTSLQAVARVGSLVVLIVTRQPTRILESLAVAIALSLVPGYLILRRFAPDAPTVLPHERGSGRRRSGVLTAVVVFACGFPTVGDVIAVKHSVTAFAAGEYAGVALVGRCVVFLAIAINVVYYPRYLAATDSTTRRRLWGQSVIACLCLSGLATVALTVDPSLTIRTLVGAQYESASQLLPLYVVGCFTWAVFAVNAYYVLARGSRVFVFGIVVPVIALQLCLPVWLAGDLLSLCKAELALAVTAAVVATLFCIQPSTGGRPARRGIV